MMTEEQILEYINQNEPSMVANCPVCGRWERREWNTSNTTIVETYRYKHETTHRQSYAIESIIRKEVANG